jgi:2'-5' RNA ligase
VIENVYRSGLIVELASADSAVAPFRAALDPHDRLGVPPHITVLFPFIEGCITDDVIETLGMVFAVVEPFDTSLIATNWFGEDVLWLAPENPEHYVSLTKSCMAAFPDHLPYGGQFEEIVPHLTIGDRAPIDAMRAAELALVDLLPIKSRAGAATLMTQTEPGGWWTRALRFPFLSASIPMSDGQ